MFDLSGRTALVTGSGQSVGAGIVRCLATQGASVAVNDIVAARAATVAAAVNDGGGRAVPAVFDVTDRSAVNAGIADAEATLGPIDILVNNAGNAGAPGLVIAQFREMDPDAWDRFVAVNLYGVLNCTKAVIDGMCERGWGRVITISSGAGVMGMKMGISVYGATKSGSIGFTRHLAKEVARAGVTANAIAPGLMGVQGITERSISLAQHIPVGRLGAPEDIGAAVVYLASNEAAWVTGQTLNVNGGDHTT